MSLERLALRGEVDTEVRPAALLARQRRLRDQPCQEMRRVEQVPQACRVADQPAVAPECRAEFGRDGLRSGGGRNIGKPRGQPRLSEPGERRTTSEDEAFEK